MKPAVGHTKTILLIDDDEDDFLFLSQALAAVSESFVLNCTQSTDHLFDTIDRYRPVLIFIDFYLPKRSGLDLLRQIKNHPKYNHIPVVMWSTSAVPADVMIEIKGTQHFFQKPCSYKELVVALREILLKNGIEVQQCLLPVT
jgi:DNA-binding NtrC family response regulator